VDKGSYKGTGKLPFGHGKTGSSTSRPNVGKIKKGRHGPPKTWGGRAKNKRKYDKGGDDEKSPAENGGTAKKKGGRGLGGSAEKSGKTRLLSWEAVLKNPKPPGKRGEPTVAFDH